jgi:hypothetical protein
MPRGCAPAAGVLRRNGHPHLWLDPETDAEAKALIERFHVDPGELPIVLCAGGQLLRSPGRRLGTSAKCHNRTSLPFLQVWWPV